MGAPLEDVQGDDPSGLLHLLAEVPLVHGTPQDHLDGGLEAGQGEGRRQEGKDEGGVRTDLGGEALQR